MKIAFIGLGNMGAHWTDSIQAAVSEAGGLIAHMRKGAIWIELSTNNLEVWREVRALADTKHHARLWKVGYRPDQAFDI